MNSAQTLHSTTVLAFRHRNVLIFAGDGQVTVNNTVMKHGANKIRRIEAHGVLAGFAGGAADGFTLFERFEAKLKEYSGQLPRAAVELAKEWRTDRYLRRLEAMMVAGDRQGIFLISGMGDVLQPDDGVVAIGSGGNFALAAARALLRHGAENMSARALAEAALGIAAEICPFTNTKFVIEEISCD